MLKKALIVFFALLLLSSGAFAVITHDTMKVFAVTEDGQTAMSADLGLTIESGTGRVWSSVEPLIGTSTQATEKIAVSIAKNYFSRVDAYDYKFDINSNASLVDGPSAGAAMTLLVVSMLEDKKVPENVGITGTITTDGSVGQVGGVFKKAQEAARIGIKLFMIPSGEAKQIVKNNTVESINLIDYASKNWGMKVVEVNNIDDVLKLAFTEISSIDVNSAKSEMPDFVPQSIAISPNLSKMKELTNTYIQKATDSVSNARKSLTGTLLNDPGTLDALLAALTNAEDSLQSAKILADQNFLYSAANYAFLAQVSANFVGDISKDPSLADPGSPSLDLRIMDLKKQIEQQKKDLNDFVPIEDWEWHIAAQERLEWAEQKIDALIQQKTVAIQPDGSADSLQDLQDFEFAGAWLGASENFAALTKTSTKKVRSKTMFNNEIATNILNAQNNINALPQEDNSDTERRIETAKKEQEYGWSAAALFDSSSALALSNAAIFTQNKDLNELTGVLEQKTADLKQQLAQKGNNFAWAQLYLDHANYYLEGVYFYKSKGMNLQALEMAKSGVSIAYLAEAIFNASKQADAYYSSVPQSELVAVENSQVIFLPSEEIIPAITALLIVAIILVSLFLLVRYYKKVPAKNSAEAIKQARARLDSLFAEKKISLEKYLEMHSILESRLQEIGRDRASLSHTTVKNDRMRFELQALRKTLLELQKQRKQGVITKRDFEKSSAKIALKIAFLRKAIAEDEKDISAEKSKIKKELVDYSAEAKKIVSSAKKAKTKKEKK
ncbi:MAG TPA: S16 family serine protease [archaeon]|nr:S16 family serine protease [archaeon]